MGREEVFEHFGLDPAKRLIGLLPGSRNREIDTLLPVMIRAAEMIRDRMPNVQFLLPRAPTIGLDHLQRHLAGSDLNVLVVDTLRYNARGAMDFALVASGTATLETGLLLCPMVILYRVAWSTWLLGRMLVRIPHIGLINIVAGREVVPEILQSQCRPEVIADRALSILDDPEAIARTKADLARVKQEMGEPGASGRAAEIILAMLNGEGTRGEGNSSGRAA
jgi:lipid-A-disaccharide synthase